MKYWIKKTKIITPELFCISLIIIIGYVLVTSINSGMNGYIKGYCPKPFTRNAHYVAPTTPYTCLVGLWLSDQPIEFRKIMEG